jgi:hypothetical protein
MAALLVLAAVADVVQRGLGCGTRKRVPFR